MLGYTFVNKLNSFIGISDYPKPTLKQMGIKLCELDTGKDYIFNGEEWVEIIGPGTRIKIFNTESLAWEAATKGSGVGQAVSVENFPAVISGSAVPISDAKYNPTNEYKASDIDASGNPEYYGFIKADGGWYILQITDGVNLRYCKGDSDYTTNWGNRKISLSYNLFHLVF